MPRYLTEEWLEVAQRALDADSTLAGASAAVEFSVLQIVKGGPDGDVTYHVRIDHGSALVGRGTIDAPSVTFIQSWETATAIAQGELSAQGAFMNGHIRVRGDLAQLVADGDVLAGLDDVLADLRAATTY